MKKRVKKKKNRLDIDTKHSVVDKIWVSYQNFVPFRFLLVLFSTIFISLNGLGTSRGGS